MISLARVDAFAFRIPIPKPIKVAFGAFRDRPMVLVRITDKDGAIGWGEIWSNWPAVGAEHRARLAVDLGQAIIDRNFAAPADVFDHLTQLTEVMVLQTGEIGPFTQVIAGIDIAVWDLVARGEGRPLHRCLSDRDVDRVPVYATSINPDQPEVFAAACYAQGHRAFKLKIGFEHVLDVKNIAAVREAIGPDAEFMIDANQSLSIDSALDIVEEARSYDLRWLEEPLRVDAPAEDWKSLSSRSAIALAGGENLRDRQFDDWISQGDLKYYQPDITKWGGVTGCTRVAKSVAAANLTYCPHVFGGGIASLASLHVLAAAGTDGTLEMDCHPNAGRELIVGDLLPVCDGTVPVPREPGLGAEIDLPALAPYQTWGSQT